VPEEQNVLLGQSTLFVLFNLYKSIFLVFVILSFKCSVSCYQLGQASLTSAEGL